MLGEPDVRAVELVADLARAEGGRRERRIIRAAHKPSAGEKVDLALAVDQNRVIRQAGGGGGLGGDVLELGGVVEAEGGGVGRVGGVGEDVPMTRAVVVQAVVHRDGDGARVEVDDARLEQLHGADEALVHLARGRAEVGERDVGADRGRGRGGVVVERLLLLPLLLLRARGGEQQGEEEEGEQQEQDGVAVELHGVCMREGGRGGGGRESCGGGCDEFL